MVETIDIITIKITGKWTLPQMTGWKGGEAETSFLTETLWKVIQKVQMTMIVTTVTMKMTKTLAIGQQEPPPQRPNLLQKVPKLITITRTTTKRHHIKKAMLKIIIKYQIVVMIKVT